MPEELTPKQLRFVEEYIIDFNGTRAFQRAGFSAKSDGAASAQACKMLKEPRIKNKVRELVSERTFRNKISIDRTLREIAYMALSDPADVFDLTADTLTLLPLREIPEYARRAIQSISFKIKAGIPETTIKFWDKNAALDKLMRHMGQYAADKDPVLTKKETTPLSKLDLSLEERKRIRDAVKKLRSETPVNGDVPHETETNTR